MPFKAVFYVLSLLHLWFSLLGAAPYMFCSAAQYAHWLFVMPYLPDRPKLLNS